MKLRRAAIHNSCHSYINWNVNISGNNSLFVSLLSIFLSIIYSIEFRIKSHSE